MAGKDIEITLKSTKAHPVILSFPDLFTPKEYENDGNKSYVREANFIIGEDHPQTQELKDAIRAAIAAKWPSNPPTIPVDRRPLRSGMVIDPDTEEKTARWDGYDGKNFVSANRRCKANTREGANAEPNPIQLIDGIRGPDKKFIRLKESDGKLYAGCMVNAIIRIYAYDGTKHGNPHRVNASIEAVQFAGHGEAFGAKPVDVEDKFDEVDGLMEDGFDGDDTASDGAGAGDPNDDLL